jgi:hypothetical protein
MKLRPMFSAVAVVLALAACSQQDKKPRLAQTAVVGLWGSDSVAGAGAATSLYTLRMKPDGLAEFTTQTAGKPPVTERGTWDGADSLVRVVVRGEGTASRPTSLLMAIRGNVLGLVQFDTTAWGPAGLTLTRR